MPQKLFDAEGKEVEVPTAEELASLTAAATKVSALEASIKDLEEGANPNWKEIRAAKKSLEAERDDWKAKAEAAGHKVEPGGISKTEMERIADERASAALLNEHKNNILSRFGDKREVVESRFNKLSAGEVLTREKIEEIVTESARAVGVVRDISHESRSVSSRGTVAPDFGDGRPKEEGYATSEAGIATRVAMGLTPEPKK